MEGSASLSHSIPGSLEVSVETSTSVLPHPVPLEVFLLVVPSVTEPDAP